MGRVNRPQTEMDLIDELRREIRQLQLRVIRLEQEKKSNTVADR